MNANINDVLTDELRFRHVVLCYLLDTIIQIKSAMKTRHHGGVDLAELQVRVAEAVEISTLPIRAWDTESEDYYDFLQRVLDSFTKVENDYIDELRSLTAVINKATDNG